MLMECTAEISTPRGPAQRCNACSTRSRHNKPKLQRPGVHAFRGSFSAPLVRSVHSRGCFSHEPSGLCALGPLRRRLQCYSRRLSVSFVCVHLPLTQHQQSIALTHSGLAIKAATHTFRVYLRPSCVGMAVDALSAMSMASLEHVRDWASL